MIWMKDVYECAKNEAKRLRSEYGEAFPAERSFNPLLMKSIANSLMRSCHRVMKRKIHPNLCVTISLLSSCTGTAYSGHYSAYIYDCMSEGNWTPLQLQAKEKMIHPSSKTLCFFHLRPGENPVLESSPLNIVLSIFHSSFDDPNVTTVRNRRQADVITHNVKQPAIKVPPFLPPPASSSSFISSSV
jgi:hypothetical protein